MRWFRSEGPNADDARRLRWAAAAGLALHVVALGATYRSTAAVCRSSGPAVVNDAVDVVLLPVAQPTESFEGAVPSAGTIPAGESRPTIGQPTPRRASLEPDPRATSDPARAPDPASPPGAPAVAAPLVREYDGAPARDDGATPVWGIPGTIAGVGPDLGPTRPRPGPAAVPNDIAGRVLTESLRTKDREIGLEVPAAGTAASVVATAVRSVDAPDDARGTYEVVLGARGEVTAVRVVSMTAGSAAQWERAAKSALAELTSSGLIVAGLPPGTKIVVRTRTRLRLPSGRKEPVEVQTTCMDEVLEGIGSALDELEDRDAPPKLRDPLGTGEEDKKKAKRFCVPVAIGIGFDPVDIGAHVARTVRSDFEVVRPGERKLPSARVAPVDDRMPWLPARDGRAPRRDKGPPPPQSIPKGG